MPEHYAELLGATTEVVDCEWCSDTVRMSEDDHAVFAAGTPYANEPNYRVAVLCSPSCGRNYIEQVIGDAERRGQFLDYDEFGGELA